MSVSFISNFMKSSTVYAASLCKFVRFETTILPSIRFDIINWAYRTLKSLWIYFLTVNRKKTFRKIFSYKFGCRTKTLSDFWKCFTELYFFYWLFMLVVSRAILIAVLFVFNRSWTSLTGVLKSAPIKRFLRLHIVIKPINKKVNIINSLLCWRVILLMFIQTLDHRSQIWRLSKVRTGRPYCWFWNFFERFR